MLTCRMFAGQSCRSGTFRIARGTATLGCAPFPQPLLGASRLLPLASSLHPLAPHIAPLNPAHKSFLLRTYEKTPCNYSGMNTYETKDLKFSRMNTYRKTGGVGGGGRTPRHSLSLFCSLQGHNLLAFMLLRTLLEKIPGVGTLCPVPQLAASYAANRKV